jgi:hypothetical protein
MANPDEPLGEHEVGPYDALSRRPNPDNLVIWPVPPFEEQVASLQKRLGRELTPNEREIARRKAPSIVVTRAAAEAMQAARLGRPPAAPTEGRLRPPTVKGAYQDMPSEPAARKEAAVELFGQHLFSFRNQLIERLERLVESAEIRKHCGSLHRKEYDAVAALPPEQREAAIALARKAIDLYMQDILALFTGTGDDDRFGSEHAINYQLMLQVKDVTSDEVVEEFAINRECEKVFSQYYGRWLNRYGNHR